MISSRTSWKVYRDQLQLGRDLDLRVQAAIDAAVLGVEGHDTIDLTAIGFRAHGKTVTDMNAAQHRRIAAALHLPRHR